MRRVLFCAIAMALVGLCAVPAFAADAPTAATEQTTTQLPRDVRTTNYAITITPDAAGLKFEGKVAISIEVLQPTRGITLNAIDMTFPEVSLTSDSSHKTFAAPSVKVDPQAQTATFSFDQVIPAGSYRLWVRYTGKIGTQADGLFAIDYDTHAGKRRALYTQFENSDARRFVPSWDEPAYKATFELAAVVPDAQMAVSNTPIADRTPAGKGKALVRFGKTPKMSTYLLFFGLGDFDRATAMVDGTQLGVVTQRGAGSQARFALESAQAVLHEYNDYFGTPYPLPKLDNIASPGTSEFFGAMENWGAIFTFEHDMLLDPTISTQSDKEGVFETEAHEMAHQWFGDLVTMQWWDDLWLNEGFASWMEGRTTAKLHPEWNTALEAVDVRESAMMRDAVATTHPVVQHIETVEQANQAFDSITYSKGESVIRMLEAYVGADAWRDGVRRYMKAHAYGNTVSDDLWREVEAAAGKPITTIAHDFTLQPGIPLIQFERSTCTNGSATLTLSQGEFTQDRPDKTPLSWHVPVIAKALDGSASASTLVENGHASLTVPSCATVVVNAGQTGYFRTLYSPQQLAALRNDFGKLPTIDQLGIMGDAWALGMAGRQPASDYLDLALAASADADPKLWMDIADSFDALDGYYHGDKVRQTMFRAYAIARLSPVFAKVGWEARPGESGPVIKLRSELIGTLSALGDPGVIAEARRRYESKDPAAMPVALRKTILAVIARHADGATWDRLHAAALEEKTALIKQDLYELLSRPEDPELAQRALDLSLTDEPGATSSAEMIAIVSWEHPELALDFAIAHKTQVDAKVDSTSRSRYYPALGTRSLDLATIAKIRAFADAYIAAGSRREADTAIAGIQYRIKVRNERLPAIDAWLQRPRY